MSEVPNGTNHPPPEELISMARTAMLIRTIAWINFSIDTPKGSDQKRKIENRFLKPIEEEMKNIYGLEITIPPAPTNPEEGKVWALRSLTKHLYGMLNNKAK